VSQGYACAPAVTGWTGPGYLYAAAGTPPACGAAWVMKPLGGYDPEGAPATCTACSCGTPLGHACPEATVEASTTSTCPLLQVPTTAPVGACGVLTVLGNSGYLKSTLTATGGTCAVDGGAVSNLPAPGFAENVALCTSAAAPTGCSGGERCLPTPPSGYQKICVYQSGTVLCPGGYPNVIAAYETISDGRGCDRCTCGAAAGGSCTGKIEYFGADNGLCAGLPSIVAAGACVAVPPATIGKAGFIAMADAPTGGSCTPAGGGPDGGVTGASPITICCQ